MLPFPTPPSRFSLPPQSVRRAALADESGFTLIELVIVVLIIGIMLSIAVPSFIGLQDRANRSAAESTVRAAVSDTEAFYADNGTFTGISASVLQTTYDKTLDTTNLQVVATSGGNSFTMCSKSAGFYGYKLGPAAVVTSSPTAPSGCTL